jgi:hypothetical protein
MARRTPAATVEQIDELYGWLAKIAFGDDGSFHTSESSCRPW